MIYQNFIARFLNITSKVRWEKKSKLNEKTLGKNFRKFFIEKKKTQKSSKKPSKLKQKLKKS